MASREAAEMLATGAAPLLTTTATAALLPPLEVLVQQEAKAQGRPAAS